MSEPFDWQKDTPGDDLHTYLTGLADRCSVCGWHPESQGHASTCPPTTPPLSVPIELRARGVEDVPLPLDDEEARPW